MTIVGPPLAPTNLTATVNDDGSVTLSWVAPDDDSITGYQILRVKLLKTWTNDLTESCTRARVARMTCIQAASYDAACVVPAGLRGRGVEEGA